MSLDEYRNLDNRYQAHFYLVHAAVRAKAQKVRITLTSRGSDWARNPYRVDDH